MIEILLLLWSVFWLLIFLILGGDSICHVEEEKVKVEDNEEA